VSHPRTLAPDDQNPVAQAPLESVLRARMDRDRLWTPALMNRFSRRYPPVGCGGFALCQTASRHLRHAGGRCAHLWEGEISQWGEVHRRPGGETWAIPAIRDVLVRPATAASGQSRIRINFADNAGAS
jgi:hypothetical protein